MHRHLCEQYLLIYQITGNQTTYQAKLADATWKATDHSKDEVVVSDVVREFYCE